jgi:hypothetical protein
MGRGFSGGPCIAQPSEAGSSPSLRNLVQDARLGGVRFADGVHVWFRLGRLWSFEDEEKALCVRELARVN